MSWSSDVIKNLWRWGLVTKALGHLLESHWVQTLASYDCIYVGFSGGLDSTVLLHALACEPQLLTKICAVHINHGLSPQAQVWQIHCQQLCERLAISYQARTISFNRQANIEEAARHARYQVFSQLVQVNQCLLTAHHHDDQAETVLLHLFRGAGIKGLSGISDTLAFGQGFLYRPLLGLSRDRLLAYAKAHQLAWIEDESNADVHFSRNFLRQQVLPLLQTKWPGVSRNLVRTSELCRQAQANLDDLAEMDYPNLITCPNELAIKPLQQLSEARLSNVLRCWLQKNAARMPNYDTLSRLLSEVIHADHDANPELRWGNWVIKRYRGQLSLHQLESVSLFNPVPWLNFPDSVELPGRGMLSARLAESGLKISPDDQIDIRCRQGGETFIWHGQTKSLKKLMQQWAIPPWLRSTIPLIYVNQRLAAVVGYAMSDLFHGSEATENYDVWDISYGNFG